MSRVLTDSKQIYKREGICLSADRGLAMKVWYMELTLSQKLGPMIFFFEFFFVAVEGIAEGLCLKTLKKP